MNINISGSGTITGGEYDDISVSGSASTNGLIRCSSIHCSGSLKGNSKIQCKNEIKISGSFSCQKAIHAGRISVSGKLKSDGVCEADNEISISGAMDCDGSVKCSNLLVSGVIKTASDVEAENVEVIGSIDCGGLLNAEKILIKMARSMTVDSIGGGTISIYPGYKDNKITRLPLLSELIGATSGASLTVNGDIEGDVIALENVTAKCVAGRIVAIGAGCKIDTVKFSEKIEIDLKAKVKHQEKTEFNA